MLNIPIILGTAREGRNSLHVANFLLKILNKYQNIKSIIVDPKEFNFEGDGRVPNTKYSEITFNADAFLIVVPEYNHSFPGSLKRLLDAELENYIHKPVAFAGVSIGPWGGTRAIESLINVVRELGLISTFTDINFPNVTTIFNEKGELIDEKYIVRSENAIEELIWMAEVLIHGRKNVKSKYHNT